jgi:hypothetical protein
MYSARLTHQKPEIKDTKEYAKLIYVWGLLDNSLYKNLSNISNPLLLKHQINND